MEQEAAQHAIAVLRKKYLPPTEKEWMDNAAANVLAMNERSVGVINSDFFRELHLRVFLHHDDFFTDSIADTIEFSSSGILLPCWEEHENSAGAYIWSIYELFCEWCMKDEELLAQMREMDNDADRICH